MLGSDDGADGRHRSRRSARRLPGSLGLERDRVGAGAAHDHAGTTARTASAMRLDFDFHGGGGFVVARKLFQRAMPPSWAIRFQVRGAAPANKLELKLADPSGRNVWWFHRDAFEFPADWQTAADPQPRGRVRLGTGRRRRDARARRDRDRDRRRPGRQGQRLARGPALRGSRAEGAARGARVERAARTRSGVGSRRLAADELAQRAGAAARSGSRSTSRRSASTAASSSTGSPRGGARAFEVQTSNDGTTWTRAWAAAQAEGDRNYVSLPGGASRFVRLDLLETQGGAGFGITAIGVRPNDFSRTPDEFFHNVAPSSGAASTRAGSFANRATGRRSASRAVLLRRCSMRRGCSRSIAAAFRSSRSCSRTASSSPGRTPRSRSSSSKRSLPIPSSQWRANGFVLTTTAFATAAPAGPVLYVRYRIENTRDISRAVTFFCALRPYQVNAAVAGVPGIGRRVPDRRTALARRRSVGRRAQAGDPARTAGRLRRRGLRAGRRHAISRARGSAAAGSGARRVPSRVGRASLRSRARTRRRARVLRRGTLRRARPRTRRLRRAATDRRRGELRERHLGVAGEARTAGTPRRRCRASLRGRAAHRGRSHPDQPRRACAPARTAALHAIVDPGRRDDGRGAAPDGLRGRGAGLPALVRAVSEGRRQRAVRRRSRGARLAVRSTTVTASWRSSWPSTSASRAIAISSRSCGPLCCGRSIIIESLRNQRLGREFASGDRKACYGILPESVSHEGYLAQPVHAYWDDFWALRGIGDAAHLARVLGDTAQERRLGELRDDLRSCLYASIETTIAQRGLAYVPGSVEWADFDVTATATALTTTDAAETSSARRTGLHLRRVPPRLPQAPRRHDRLEQLHGLRDPQSRRAGAPRARGRGARAARLLPGRPPPARVESVARDLVARSAQPGSSRRRAAHMDRRGVGARGAEPVRVRASDERIAGAGRRAFPPPGSTSARRSRSSSLPTWYGRLSYTMSRQGHETLQVAFSGDLETPPGGIVVHAPLSRPLVRVTVDGQRMASVEPARVTLDRWPATLVFEC